MKKEEKRAGEEMVSLNQEIFSLEAGNLAVEELEQRLELALAAIEKFVCSTFACGRFESCVEFACGSFKVF